MAWISSLQSLILLIYSKSPKTHQKPSKTLGFGKNPLPMGKIPKTQGFSQHCFAENFMCEIVSFMIAPWLDPVQSFFCHKFCMKFPICYAKWAWSVWQFGSHLRKKPWDHTSPPPLCQWGLSLTSPVSAYQRTILGGGNPRWHLFFNSRISNCSFVW